METELKLRMQVFLDTQDRFLARIKQMSTRMDDTDSILKNLIGKTEKLAVKINKQDQIIIDKNDKLREDLMEIVLKSQRTTEKQQFEVMKELGQAGQQMKLVVDGSSQQTIQLLQKHSTETQKLMDDFKVEMIRSGDTDKRHLLGSIDKFQTQLESF